MKKLILSCLIAFCLALPMGCTSTYYEVKTKDGQEFVTKDEPGFNKKSQSYEFTDVKGNKWIFNREQIQSIEKKEKGN